MKLAILSVVVSLSVLGVLAFQAVREEVYLHRLRAHMMETSMEITKKEQAILEVKTKIQRVKNQLNSVNKNIDEIRKKKGDAEKAMKEYEASLQTCNNEKGEAEKKKTEVTESMAKYKVDHEAAKAKAQEDIQNLKEQILNRDKAICAFADTTNAEARKMCGIPEAQK